MFGKFSKKKSIEPTTETISKQKNDLFTLLEESPKKNNRSQKIQSEPSSKTTTPEPSSKTTTPDPHS